MADRVTQQVLQVAFNTTPDARVTSVVLEALVEPPAPTVRVTSIALEVLQSHNAGGGGGSGAAAMMYVIAG